MFNRLKKNAADKTAKRTARRLFPRMARSEDGAAAIEFALLALPYFMIVFAIFETFIAFAGEQLVGSAVDNMVRKLRTGHITAADDTKSTYMSQEQFRQLFCSELSVLVTCSGSELSTPSKLFIDVRNVDDFAHLPGGLGKDSVSGDIDTSDFGYNPGGPGTTNIVRAVYKWDVMFDLLRPYFTTVKLTSDPGAGYYLMMATTAYKNEPFPE